MALASCEYTETSSVNCDILQKIPQIYVLALLAINTHIPLAHFFQTL